MRGRRDRVPNCVPNSAILRHIQSASEQLKRLYRAKYNSRSQTLNPKVPGSIPGGGTSETALRRGFVVQRRRASTSRRGRGRVGARHPPGRMGTVAEAGTEGAVRVSTLELFFDLVFV